MLKVLISAIIILFITSCDQSYERAEIQAIQDISNDYLDKNFLRRISHPNVFPNSNDNNMPKMDSLEGKVYLSDALLPLSQVKQDNEWIFIDNNFIETDSAVFYKIVNSSKFNELGYREYKKFHLELNKPYKQMESSTVALKEDEEYAILKFSRVCFDEQEVNGVVVIDYSVGVESGSTIGYHGALLIKKQNNKWTYISQRKN